MPALHELVQWLPVADLPEMVIRLYLVGDVCLDDDDETLDAVFTTKYTTEKLTGTFMDPDCLVEHSFNDEPCWSGRWVKFWYRNGKLGRSGNQPCVIHLDTGRKEWWRRDRFVMAHEEK